MPPAISQVHAVASLSSLYVLRMLGLFMVLPVITLSGDDYQNSSVFLLGVALGVYGVTQALLQIPMGLLSDKYGRKPIIFIGLLLFCAGSLLAANAETIWGLIIGRTLQGTGAIAGVLLATVGDVTTEQHRTKAMAVIGASIGVAFTLALIIGPAIASSNVLHVSGVRLLFWVTALLCSIGMIILWLWVPNIASLQTKTTSLSLSALGSILDATTIRLLYFGVFVLHYALMVFFLGVPNELITYGFTVSQHSWVYMGLMLVALCTMVPLMTLTELYQWVKQGMVLAILALLIMLLVLAFIPLTAQSLLVYLALFFIAFNFLEANLPSLLTRVASPENKGLASGVFASCQFSGAALGGIIGGALYQWWGFYAACISAVILLCVWALLAGRMVVPNRKKMASTH